MPDPADRDVTLAHAFARFATGVAVLSFVDAAGSARVVRAVSFNSVSLDPPLVLWTLHRDSEHAPHVRGAAALRVHVLAEEVPGFDTGGAGPGPEGVVDPARCAAWIACDSIEVHEAADHLVFIARITGCGWSERMPLVDCAGQYVAVRAHPAGRSSP